MVVARVAVDIRRLRDEQIADEAGRLIGKAVGRGQVMWSARGKEILTLIGRAEQVDLSEVFRNIYTCLSQTRSNQGKNFSKRDACDLLHPFFELYIASI